MTHFIQRVQLASFRSTSGTSQLLLFVRMQLHTPLVTWTWAFSTTSQVEPPMHRSLGSRQKFLAAWWLEFCRALVSILALGPLDASSVIVASGHYWGKLGWWW